jgi:hypothetical protein
MNYVELSCRGTQYRVFCSGSKSEEVRAYVHDHLRGRDRGEDLKTELDLSRPVVVLCQVDNYDDLVQNISSYEAHDLHGGNRGPDQRLGGGLQRIILRGDRDGIIPSFLRSAI